MANRDTRNTETFGAGARVQVMLPLPIAGPYDYRVPADLTVGSGSFVEVPLGSRRANGVVWGPGGHDIEETRLKDIEAVLDVPPMPAAMRAFVDWVADYTLYNPGAVLRMAMSVPDALHPPRPKTVFARSAQTPGDGFRMTPARQRVLEEAADGPPRSAADLARAAGVGTSVVKGLAAAGLLDVGQATFGPRWPVPDPKWPGPELSVEQGGAAARLVASVGAARFAVSVLDGVTGSGKTEVYFEAIAAALEAGGQVLVLLPEIALSAQWLARFEDRFGARPAEWHSDLTQATRRAAWRAVADGTIRLVVGARSALFLPFENLGLIVVDEEHDASYKQEEGVVYHARDMAVVRAQLGECPIVLVSATPSLETMTNVQRGRYGYLHLPHRHGTASLPDISAVDLRADPPPRQAWLSPPLREALCEVLGAGEQAMLFLNRRGYAPLTLCRHCGHRLHCPRCTAWLVEHRLSRRLQCHHCGYGAVLPGSCPECGAADSFAACGPGVERIAEEAAALLPEARIAVVASDTVRGPAAAAEVIRRIVDHEIDLLIGTQIIAKGHHFPMLTLVGVVDADLGLSGGDLRAAERTFQLLYQVAGRAGRAERPGRVLLQTFQPHHPVIEGLLSGDRDRFLEAEAADRKARHWPPYGRLAAVVVSGRDVGRVEAVAAGLGRVAPSGDGIETLGPAPAPLSLLRGRHRRRLLVRTRLDIDIQGLMRHWLGQIKVPGGVRLHVDIGPYSFL
ncbi:MAG: primosomal protein N' [Alphaproteobacteria bacterium]|nr:primosomal protein N' [Alphaproteobacteria bacterium]